VAFISLYVNNCTIVASHPLLQLAKDTLVACFQMKDLGEATLVLGIEIICNCACGTITLQQAGHIQAILAHFNMTDCKPQQTPMVSDMVLAKLPAMALEHTKIPYWQAMGMLLYLAQAT
jgi:hypothetical protein